MELFDFDNNLRTEYGIFCGIDEAGRGPLAGDVFAAAVVFDTEEIIGINDSKKLTANRRELLYDEIISKAKDFSIARASVEEIDNINILRATFLAMTRAFNGLKTEVQFALIDGNQTPTDIINAKTLVKGDGISASIAAASILAKVARDRYMMEMSHKYPNYGFDRHKGYGTKLHYESLEKYGVCDIHRKTFLKKLLNNGQ